MKSPEVGGPGRGDFREALHEAERTYEALSMPAMVDARLRWKLGQRREPRQTRSSRRGWVMAGAGLAATAALLLFFVSGERAAPVTQDAGPVAEVLAGPIAVVSGGASVTTAPGGVVVLGPGKAAVASHGFDGIVDTAERAELRQEPEGVRLVRGRVTIAVQKRMRPEPVRIYVSHGVVEVLGTRFELAQNESGGEVKLYEGVIRFSDGASARTLTPGQSLRWPQVEAAPAAPSAHPAPPKAQEAPHPGEVAPAAEPAREARAMPLARGPGASRARPVRKSVAAEGRELASVLDGVASSRTRGEYDEATASLRKALRGRWRTGTRERLSFELGSILGDHLGDRAAACDYWSHHHARFRSGRYRDEVKSALHRLGCPSDAKE